MSVDDHRRVWRDRGRVLLAEAPNIARVALSQGFVVTATQAHQAGVPAAGVRQAVRAGSWSRPRRGVIALSSLDGLTRPVLEATAAVLACRGTTIAGASAAAVYGLPLLETPNRPTLIGRLPLDRRTVAISPATLTAQETCRWYGSPLTSPARTVIDLACTDRRQGLVAADAALRADLVAQSQLVSALRERPNRPGLSVARRVLALASPLPESPLESLTRLAIDDHGLPMPEWQAWICDTSDGWSARVDGLWRARNVVLEADGRVKYTDRALWDEKLRQERLERLGYRVVRVTWADVVRHPAATADRLRWALGVGGLRTA